MMYFFVRTSAVCFSQEYVPIVREGAYWCYSCSWGDHDYGTIAETVNSFIIMNDTIIGGFIYKNVGVIQRWGHNIPENTYYDLDVFQGYYGGIREDSDKVHFYKYQSTLLQNAFTLPDTIEVLLYDFNVEVGDTIFRTDDFNSTYSIVTEIDSILLLDDLHYQDIHVKDYLATDDYLSNSEWVQSAGDLSLGLFSLYRYFGEGPPGCEFISYSFNDTELFSYNVWGGCRIGGVNPILVNESKENEIYYFQNNLFVNLKEDYSELYIDIFNSKGALINSYHLNDQVIIIKLENYSSGIYLAAIRSNESFVGTYKFLLTKY